MARARARASRRSTRCASSQDRLLEKELFGRLGIPTPPFRAVDSLADLEAAVAALGLPGVLKTRRLGYDGKGQRVLRTPRRRRCPPGRRSAACR